MTKVAFCNIIDKITYLLENKMPITDFLVKNAELKEDDVCLVEINPEIREKQRITWKDYSLVEPSGAVYRKELTWGKFDRRANRIANYLIETGVKKGDKVQEGQCIGFDEGIQGVRRHCRTQLRHSRRRQAGCAPRSRPPSDA